MDCGPSCLAMIAKHYGIQPNIDVIRKKCSLGKAGVSLQVESVFPVAHNEEKVQGSIHGLCRRPWKRIDTIQQGRILWALD